jgi:hypothetical protein
VVEHHHVRNRRPDEPYEIRGDPRDVNGLFPNRNDCTISLILNVNYDTLRGSARGLHGGIADSFNIEPGETREFQSEHSQTVKIYWYEGASQPAISSIGTISKELNLIEGMSIRLKFDLESETVTVFPLKGSSSLEDRTGLNFHGRAPLSVLAESLSVERESVITTLRDRGDIDVIDALHRHH